MARSSAGRLASRGNGRRTKRRGRRLTWGTFGTYIGIALAFVAVAGLVILVSRSQNRDQHATAEAMSGPAPDFTLPSLSGEQVSLASYRGSKNVLLFFNEGYGCAPCWQQSQEIQERLDELEAADTEYLVVTVDPANLAEREAERWRLAVPILSDTKRTVARAYNTLGFGMHADKPNHTFVFVDKTGEIRWWKDYASMRAPTDEVVAKVQTLAGDVR